MDSSKILAHWWNTFDDEPSNSDYLSLVQMGYEEGWKAAEKVYTNDCFFCGPMGEWSLTACDECLAKEENQWFKEKR